MRNPVLLLIGPIAACVVCTSNAQVVGFGGTRCETISESGREVLTETNTFRQLDQLFGPGSGDRTTDTFYRVYREGSEPWVEGYLTALNQVRSGLGQSVVEFSDGDGRWRWLQNYCSQNQDERLHDAADALFAELSETTEASEAYGLGVGTDSCGYLIENSIDDEAERVFRNWAEGYLSGFNSIGTHHPELAGRLRVVDISDQDGQWLWLKNHCAATPLTRIYESIALLYNELRGRQYPAGSVD